MPDSIVPYIIFLNIFVFLLWYILAPTGSGFMAQNFVVSWSLLAEGRIWTLITSVFSHNYFFHIFVNLYVLFGFGLVLESVLGTSRFLIFYLIAGVAASFSHSLVSAFLLGRPSLPALGASGAISGVILVYSILFPANKILFFGIIPVPAMVGAFIFVGLDIWGLVAQTGGGGLPIGHGAHLGGALAGVLYYLIYLRHQVELP